MKHLPHQSGFTFFELMIAVAVVGILAAAAIPAYRGYIDTANMTKVSASFEEAVRVATNTFARRKTRIALGIQTTVPNTTENWIKLLNPNDSEAPGGGPAFIPSTNRDSERGDALKGAIGVRWRPAVEPKISGKGDLKTGRGATLELWKPLYSDLTGQHVTISESDISIEKFSD